MTDTADTKSHPGKSDPLKKKPVLLYEHLEDDESEQVPMRKMSRKERERH